VGSGGLVLVVVAAAHNRVRVRVSVGGFVTDGVRGGRAGLMMMRRGSKAVERRLSHRPWAGLKGRLDRGGTHGDLRVGSRVRAIQTLSDYE
jgi:hypothetical protein